MMWTKVLQFVLMLLGNDAFKRLIVKILREAAKLTKTDFDDAIVDVIEEVLFEKGGKEASEARPAE